MSDELTIRQACERDVNDIAAMVRELAVFEKLEHLAVGTVADLKEALFGAQPVVKGIIAEYEGEPTGFALLFETFSSFTGRRGMWIEDLYIKTGYRRRGIGRRLLEYIIELARENGAGRLEWSALDWNENAHRLYRSVGAKSLDDWRIFRMTRDDLNRGKSE